MNALDAFCWGFGVALFVDFIQGEIDELKCRPSMIAAPVLAALVPPVVLYFFSDGVVQTGGLIDAALSSILACAAYLGFRRFWSRA